MTNPLIKILIKLSKSHRIMLYNILFYVPSYYYVSEIKYIDTLYIIGKYIKLLINTAF